MNLLAWRGKNCVSVPEEFWREDKSEIIAYINDNPNKIYLLSDVRELFDEEISIRFAREIKFPCAAKLISASGEFTVKTLSDALESISYDENFMPTGKNFLVVPDDFSSIASEIKKQCSILQVPLEICTEKEFSAIATEQKLIDNAEKFLSELDGVKNLCDKKSKLKFPENISLVEECLTATGNLERYLQSFDAPIKLVITGEQNEHLPEIFKRLNFDTEICSAAEVANKLPNCNACVFVESALSDFAQAENFLQTVADLPDKNKIIFVMIRPALREQEAAINFSRILLDFAKVLDAPIFFLDAPEIFIPLLTSSDELLTPDDLTDLLGLTGRDKFFTRISLEKFFESLPNPSSKALLQKTGVPYLENYLRHSLKKNPSMTEKLLCQIERAISFVDDDALKNLQLNQIKKISIDARQAEFFREKISLIAMHEKTVSANAVAKALLYDVNNAINNFVQEITLVTRKIFEELTASDEFCTEKLGVLYQGKIPAELKNLIAITEERLKSECDGQSIQLIGLTKNIIGAHRTQAKEFIDFIHSTTENFSTAPYSDTSLPDVKSFNVPPFDAGLTENFSRENLSSLVKSCTRIICTSEAGNDWNSFKANNKKFIKIFHLAGTFRKKLRQNLEEVAQDKLNALKKNLRQNFFAATIEYFMQVSKICQAQRELCLNIFTQYAKDIYSKIDFLNQDFLIMEEISSALKNFHESWRLIYPKQSCQSHNDGNSFDNFLNEVLKRKNQLINLPLNSDGANNLSAEKFLPVEIRKSHNQSSSNADFSSGEKEFRSKKYENALKSFSRAAALGNIEAIKYLAGMYQEGLGTPKNIYAAIENYLDTFSLGDDDSAKELGKIFLNLKCYSHALEFYKTAEDNGARHWK